jgi:Uma2 family endonuclease
MILPLRIPAYEKFTDQELIDFCLANPDLGVERDENGQLFINMPPTFIISSYFNNEVLFELTKWNRKHKLGKILQSNTAFYLPDTSLKGPDAAFISNEKWNSLTNEQKRSFPYLVPDFVAEIRSQSDNLKELQNKMLKWVENGVKLAWLIDPNTKMTSVYNLEGHFEDIPFDSALTGYNVLPEFSVVLSDIFEE